MATWIYVFSLPGDPFFPRSDHETLTRSPQQWVLLVVATVICLLVLVYEMVSVAVRGRTTGKKMLGVWVISHQDGLKPLVSQALVRWFVPAAAGVIGAASSCVIFDAGDVLTDFVHADGQSFTVVLSGACIPWTVTHMSALWGPDGRGWPDRAAGTVVVKA